MRNFFFSVVVGLLSTLLVSNTSADLLSVTNINSLDPLDIYELIPLNLANGELVNIDRDHQFAGLPAMLQGLSYIKTANDDKEAGLGFAIEVTFDPGTILFLSIDGRVGDNVDGDPTLGNGVMDWVINDGWLDIGLTWYKANEPDTRTFQVYTLTPEGTSYTFLEQNDGGGRNMYSIAGGDGPFFFGPILTVNRDTGSLVLSTDLPTDILGYTIESELGTLNQSGWTPIAGNYDAPAGGGDGSVDPDDTWLILSAADDPTDLSEVELAGTGPMDGGTLNPGSPVTLSSGGAWSQFPIEDLTMYLLLTDGTIQYVPVQFTGNGDMPFALGDFNFDGIIDGDDHGIFAAGLHTDLSAMTVPEAYAHGDMNQDRANNFADLVLFRDIYDSLYGPGAFNALVASVPEPTGIHLFLLGGLALVLAGYKKGFQRMWRRGGQDRSILQLPRCGKMPQPQNCVHPSRTGVLRPLLGPRMIGFVAGFLGVLLIPAQAPAQLLTATNNNSLDANDVYQLNLLGLADGALVNIDRTHVFYNLPLELQGIDYVLTANDDKTATAAAPAFSVDLTFIEGTTLYLSIDSRVGDDNDDNGPTLGNGIMDWVLTQGWVDTGLTWYKENEYPDVPFHVYELTPAGTSHTFYEQNNGGTRNMYSIAGRGEGPISPTLLVNTDTGEITISNSTKLTWNLNYYEITSESGSLDPGAWNSLADQNLDSIGPGAGESWVEAGGSDSEILSEFFTLGASALAPDEMISLGFGYNPQGAQDIKFLFAIDGGTSLREGVVEYVTGGDIADFNADGDVDGADFLVWQIGFGTMSGATRAEGDANGDGAVNNADLSIWKSQFGMSGASAQGLTSTSVPEPGALDLIGLFMGGLLIVFLRQTKGKRAMDILRIRTIAGCWVIGILTQAALADYTLDRLYLMGDDDGVSANSAVSVTDDSAGVSLDHLWAYQVASGNSPIYVDTSSRPQADLNELGIRFDAVQEHYLDGPRLGLPDTSIAASIEDYAGISNRGFQLWVKPAVAGVGNLQQDIVMDTEQHGFGITADGNWFMQYGGNAYDSGITVTAGEWYHVMVVRPYGSSGSDSGARMYVNGIAVAAMSGDYTGTDQTNLAIGVRTYESFPVEPYHFFSGIVDDLEMFVLGTTTSDPPTVLGTFNLGEDNAYIATQLTGVAGDVNQDNLLNDSDIDAFVAGWKHKNLVNNIAVGDLNTITMGDLNWNGITELGDAFILHEALLEAGMGGLDFRLLSGVPEPASCLLLLVAMPAWIGMKRHGYL